MEAFFYVHADLPRQGPGAPDDVHWALDAGQVSRDARILDAGCGPGADTMTLAEARPEAQILAVDTHDAFVESARERTAVYGSRVSVECKSYLDVEGPFDFIWCAGAAYFAGYLNALEAWRPILANGGAVAFSEPSWLVEPPSEAARTFWSGEAEVQDLATIRGNLEQAGCSVQAHRWVVGDPWKAYYDPMAARLATLKAKSHDDAVTETIGQAEIEIAKWAAASDEIAYVLMLVRPA